MITVRGINAGAARIIEPIQVEAIGATAGLTRNSLSEAATSTSANARVA